MSLNEPSPDATVDSLRPSSVWTNDSAFADSAISIGGTGTPKQFDDTSLGLPSPSSDRNSLSERLTQIAAIAWAAEQDGYVDDSTKSKILRSLSSVESILEDREDGEDPASRDESSGDHIQEDRVQLEQIHQHLAATVSEMRLRHQEHRHIQALSIQKLEDIAGTCANQKKQIQDLEADVKALEISNRRLQRDSDGFQSHAEQLTAELQQKDLALQAMSSAVAGLDGFISNTSPRRGPTRRVRATRGRGRFQTHYYVDVPLEVAPQKAVDPTVEVRELRDGITAWVRGFRDVEDALTATSAAPRASSQGAGVRVAPNAAGSSVGDEDWGDFQTFSTRETIY